MSKGYIDCSWGNCRILCIPERCIPDCSHAGDCDGEVTNWVNSGKVDFAGVDPAELRVHLREYGCWDNDELASHTDNLKRLLWTACCEHAEAERVAQD